MILITVVFSSYHNRGEQENNSNWPSSAHQSAIADRFAHLQQKVAKKKTKTPISEFCGFKLEIKIRPKDQTEAFCNLCKHMVPGQNSNTTNLHEHLWAHHLAEYVTLTPRDARLSSDKCLMWICAWKMWIKKCCRSHFVCFWHWN